MPPDVFPLIALAITGSCVLCGMWIRFKARQLESGTHATEALHRITDAMEQLSDQVQALAEDNAELHDRLDFTERLLARADPRPAEPADTPV